MKTRAKQKWISIIIVVVVMAGYLGLRVNKLEYNGESVYVFAMVNITDLRPSWGEAYTLGHFTAKTPYGNIYVEPFTKFVFGHNYYNPKAVGLWGLGGRLSKVTNDLVILGNKLEQTAGFGFGMPSDEKISQKGRVDLFRGASSKQDIRIGDYDFHMLNVRITKLEDFEQFVFELDNYPKDIITLADGTEVNLYVSGLKYLTISSDGIWECRSEYSTFPVKQPGWKEYKSYESITFKENWGEFISAKEYVNKFSR
jgi:hypothetical protein